MWCAGHFAVSGAVGAAVGAPHRVLIRQPHIQSELLYRSYCLFVSLPFPQLFAFCTIAQPSAFGHAVVLQHALGKHRALRCVT